MSNSELACTYAALILADDDIEITSDKISSILSAADVTVENYWPSLFARAAGSVDIKTLVSNVSSGAGGASAAPASGDAAPAAAAEAAPAVEEEEEDDDDDMDFGLFD